MKRKENPAVRAWAIAQVEDKFGPPRDEVIHASDLTMCLRKAAFNRTYPEKLDETSILRFAMGYAIQEWFLGEEPDGIEYEGIIVSTDQKESEQVFEFKSTAEWPTTKSKGDFDPHERHPDWTKRMAIYCLAHGLREIHLLVWHKTNVPELHAWTYTFNDKDMRDAKAFLTSRRDILSAYFKKDKKGKRIGPVPGIETRMGDHECSSASFTCPHLMRCKKELVAAGAELENKDA